MRRGTLRALTVLAVGGLALALTSCGQESSGTTTTPAVAVPPASRVAPAHGVALAVANIPQTSTTPSPLPFATPEAAMRYLADAYNRDDIPSLRKVTTPDAREGLLAMRSEAVNLRLTSCEKQPAGDYLCLFAHDYPASLPVDQREGDAGAAEFLVAPADNPGWYMTVLQGCG